MIVNDQTPASLVTSSALAFGLFLLSAGAASASGASATAPSAALASPVAPAAEDLASTASPISVSFAFEGRETPVTTQAHTVAAFLSERKLSVSPDDYLSQPLDAALVDGMRLTYRPAVEVSIYIGNALRRVRTTAVTVADLLAEQRIGIGSSDRVSPAIVAPVAGTGAHPVVRITRIDSWTANERRAIAPKTLRRTDLTLAPDATRVIDPGAPGERDATVRYEQRDGGRPTSTVLASRIVREPRPKIVARGVAAYASFARVAEQGFSSAVRFAGSALHMIATAYTAGCYGCSGITASGFRAGFGIIAVDPSVIPLGTRLFIPGYGRAIAGDTGGSIHGNRIDLGFNSNGEALRWGNRPVTVYVLR